MAKRGHQARTRAALIGPLAILAVALSLPPAVARAGTKPWAIVLCKFGNLPNYEPRPPKFYKECFSELGVGQRREFDYFREVTYGALDMTGTKVFGWFLMRSHSTNELAALNFPADRAALHAWGLEVAKSHGVDLRPFWGVCVVFNAKTDSGGVGGHRVVLGYDKTDWIPSFNLHEFGHGFDVDHSWSARPDTEYGDPWDIMSALWAHTFADRYGRQTGPGMNAFHLRQLGCIPPDRVWSPGRTSDPQTFTLAALNRADAKGYLVASIPPDASTPSDPTYLIEFRRKTAWDAGIPRDTVLVHEARDNGIGYLVRNDAPDVAAAKPQARRRSRRGAVPNRPAPTPFEALPGRPFVVAGRGLTLRVLSFDLKASTAKVSVTLKSANAPLREVQTLECFDQEQRTAANIWETRFSPDGRLLLAAGDVGPSGSIPIWDVATGRLQTTLRPGKNVWYSNADFTPDGKDIVSCYSQDNQIYVWRAAGGSPVRTLAGHARPGTSVQIAPDGKRALSCSEDKSVIVWDLKQGRVAQRLPVPGEHAAARFSPDSTHVLTFGDDHSLRVWNADSGMLVHELAGHSADCAGLFSVDGTRVLSYSVDKTVRLWDAASGRELRRLEGCADAVLGAQFLHGSEHVVAWSKDRALHFWETGSGRPLRTVNLGEDWLADASAVALTRDGRRLLTLHEDQTARLRDLSTGAELCRYAGVRAPKALSISADGRHAAAGSFRAGVYLFRLPD